MVKTVYLMNGIEVSEEKFFDLDENECELECYSECLECGAKLLVCEGCMCEFDN